MPTSWSTPREGTYNGAECIVLSWQVGRCDVVAYVMRDEPRVVIPNFDFGSARDRDADAVEVEALAERFNSAELREAATRMRASGH